MKLKGKNRIHSSLYICLAFVSCIALSTNKLNAQCDTGEVEVTLGISTDNWGYECYWEIVPGSNDCGDGTIASGGNSNVGCNGGGAQNQNQSGYDDDDYIIEGEWCLELGEQYTLYYVDDWGDGGCNFDLYFEGFVMYALEGEGDGNTWTFFVTEPPALNLTMGHSNIYPYTVFGNHDIVGEVVNNGTETITSMEISYAVDGGDVQTFEVSGIELETGEEYEFTHPIGWNEWAYGEYEIVLEVSSPNGGLDENPADNTHTEETVRGPGIPNIVDQYIGLTVEPTVISSSGDQLDQPRDLDFHPVLTRKELWVINTDTENSGGSTTIYFDAGEENQTDLWKRDGNAWHFMSLPTGIAYSETGDFATSPGVFDANHNGGDPFTGPSLWSGDLDVYAEPSGGNGSHLDMLHESPYSQGIAHEIDNVYWVVDGYRNDVVRYDFKEDHGPGNSYHGDALIHRYANFEIEKDADNVVVSHCVLNDDTGILYVVDHGHQRVMTIDINTGVPGDAPEFGPYEAVGEYFYIEDYDYEEIINEGLVEPAGIEVIDDRLLVSDYATGEIIIYDLSQNPVAELDRIQTGAPGIQGIKIGPDGRIWYVNSIDNEVVRLDGVVVSVDETEVTDKWSLYPNPATDRITLNCGDFNEDVKISVLSIDGKYLFNQRRRLASDMNDIDLSELSSGLYILQVESTGFSWTQEFIKE